MKEDGRLIANSPIIEGTPQGSPLSPALFINYMPAIMHEADENLREGRQGSHKR